MRNRFDGADGAADGTADCGDASPGCYAARRAHTRSSYTRSSCTRSSYT